MTDENTSSFTNSFWGEEDKGLEVLMSRLRAGKHVCEELYAFLKERASIEEEYGRRLAKLTKNFNPKEEIGTLRGALDTIKAEVEKSSKVHTDLSNDIKAKLEKPLGDFITTQSGIRKSHNANIEKHLKSKSAQTSNVLKAREKYEARCTENNQLQQQRPDPSSKDAEKLRAKLQKNQGLLKTSDQEYQISVGKLSEIHAKWQSDFTAALVDCQKLEEDRFHFIRGNVWNFANFVSAACVADDESCERIRLSLEACNFDSDLKLFLEKSATGSRVPIPLSYINFYTGPVDTPAPQPVSLTNQRTDSLSGKDNGLTTQKSTATLQQQQSYVASNNSLSKENRSAQDLNKIASTSSLVAAPAVAAVPVSSAPANEPPQPDAEEDLTFSYDPYDVPDDVPVLFSVTVLYDYAAQAPEELSISKGNQVQVIATHEDGWWEGLGVENGRKRKGLFPSNFTESTS